MAELTHFYDEENTGGQRTQAGFSNTVNTGSNPAQILGSSLSANTKYLIVARAVYGSPENAAVASLRVQTDDDSTIETKSDSRVEFEQTGVEDKVSYLFVHSYTTDASPADIEFQPNGFADVRIDQSSLFLLDLDAASNLIAKYYFDASDAGPTDTGGEWDNDANAFDGTLTTEASTNTAAATALSGEGTTAPTTGATIGEVWLRIRYSGQTSLSALVVDLDEDSVGGTNLLTATIDDATLDAEHVKEFLITAPAGGWTWQKVNDLAISFTTTGSGSSVDVNIAEVLVFDSNGRGYFEDAQPDGGGDYSKTADTTVIASIAGSDLGTDEHLILGYASCEINNTGRYFDHSLHAAYDTSTSAKRAGHRAEGEDGTELRLSGYAIRHKASSGTPDVTLYGASENAGGGANADGGGYLIALPTDIFADFVDDYEAGEESLHAGNVTVATTGAYTPTTSGNHLIFGRTSATDTPIDFTTLHVEDGTTEIRAGDSTPSHNQQWDTAKDDEYMATFQRYSISSEITLNLEGSVISPPGTSSRSIDHWLVVVNLNEPGGAPTDTSFPHKSNRTMRHLLLR